MGWRCSDFICASFRKLFFGCLEQPNNTISKFQLYNSYCPVRCNTPSALLDGAQDDYQKPLPKECNPFINTVIYSLGYFYSILNCFINQRSGDSPFWVAFFQVTFSSRIIFFRSPFRARPQPYRGYFRDCDLLCLYSLRAPLQARLASLCSDLVLSLSGSCLPRP